MVTRTNYLVTIYEYCTMTLPLKPPSRPTVNSVISVYYGSHLTAVVSHTKIKNTTVMLPEIVSARIFRGILRITFP